MSARTNHTPTRIHVSSGRPYITKRQRAAPKGDTSHTHATRNGRGRSLSVYRRTSTPTHTRTNAKSVPMFVRLYVSLASPINAHRATNTPVSIVVTCGTRCLPWTFDAHFGNSP